MNGAVLPSGVRLPVAPVIAPPEAVADEMTRLGPNGPLTAKEMGSTSPCAGSEGRRRDVTGAAVPQLCLRSVAGRAAMNSGCA
jgi:hypothetical protein